MVRYKKPFLKTVITVIVITVIAKRVSFVE